MTVYLILLYIKAYSIVKLLLGSLSFRRLITVIELVCAEKEGILAVPAEVYCACFAVSVFCNDTLGEGLVGVFFIIVSVAVQKHYYIGVPILSGLKESDVYPFLIRRYGKAVTK